MKLASTRIALGALFLLGAATSMLCRSSAFAQPLAPTEAVIREVPFQTLRSGARSNCARPAKMIIGDEREWRRVWRVHDEKTEAPQVDFARSRVIALLAGKGGAPLGLVQVASAREQITVFFHRGAATTSTSTPFHFALIEKTGSEARFIDQNGEVCAVCHITE